MNGLSITVLNRIVIILCRQYRSTSLSIREATQQLASSHGHQPESWSDWRRGGAGAAAARARQRPPCGDGGALDASWLTPTGATPPGLTTLVSQLNSTLAGKKSSQLCFTATLVVIVFFKKIYACVFLRLIEELKNDCTLLLPRDAMWCGSERRSKASFKQNLTSDDVPARSYLPFSPSSSS